MEKRPMTDHKPVTILLVEDDPGHALLIEKNLRRAGISNDIVTLKDGGKAVDFFFGNGESCGYDCHLVYLVLLDLNLPVLDGFQVLKRLKENEKTRCIPVVVLTTTDNPTEVSRCYELGCNIYITKPVEYDQFSQAIRDLGLFLTVVKIPV